MQLFILDEDPVLAAAFACDRHVIKICTEAGQLLCAALHYYGKPVPWKPTHVNHPLTHWVRSSRAHATWTAEYGIALCHEYTRRYGGKTHKTEGVLRSLNLDGIPENGFKGFVALTPEEHLTTKEQGVVGAYRSYYKADRIRAFATWKTPSSPPPWYNNT